MSGHSKWSTIKRKKAANDARRGSSFTRLAREIALSARAGGGDADSNFALRLAIERARQLNMPKENIERAIRRGTGEDKEGSALEEISYEGYGPHGVALIIEVITDNRKRTVADLRHVLTRAGGSLADAGSVSWQFRRGAYFVIPGEGHDANKLFDLAVESGADDVTIDEEVEISAPVEAFKQISDSLGNAGVEPEEAGLRMVPKSMMELPPEDTLQVMRLIEEIEEMDDVQRLYSNLHVTEEAVELLQTA